MACDIKCCLYAVHTTPHRNTAKHNKNAVSDLKWKMNTNNNWIDEPIEESKPGAKTSEKCNNLTMKGRLKDAHTRKLISFSCYNGCLPRNDHSIVLVLWSHYAVTPFIWCRLILIALFVCECEMFNVQIYKTERASTICYTSHWKCLLDIGKIYSRQTV